MKRTLQDILKNNFARAMFLLISPLLFVGCSTWHLASEQNDALAKQFALTPGKASIYVYRGDSTNARPLTLAMGERYRLPRDILMKPLCWLYPNTFLNFELLEGTYQMLSFDERYFRTEGDNMLIGVRPDAIYFFRMDERGLVRVLEPAGKLAVQRCRLVKGQYHE